VPEPSGVGTNITSKPVFLSVPICTVLAPKGRLGSLTTTVLLSLSAAIPNVPCFSFAFKNATAKSFLLSCSLENKAKAVSATPEPA
jgi:hypothetical protein